MTESTKTDRKRGVNERGWRSDEVERRVRALEDELLADHWPDGVSTADVDTSFGPTRVYRWPGDGTPVVFLHGMGGTGVMWSPYVDRLAGRDVYALDTIGDVGRSIQRAPVTSADDLARWLEEALVALGIDRAHIVGTSYGGWIALSLAERRPERVAALTLIDSGGLAPLRFARFLLSSVPSLFAGIAPGPVRRRIARRRPLINNPRLQRMVRLGVANHPFTLPRPELLSDAALRSIAMPTTVIVAGKSAPLSAKVATARARLIPGATIDVVKDAGHEVSLSHVDRCIAALG